MALCDSALMMAMLGGCLMEPEDPEDDEEGEAEDDADDEPLETAPSAPSPPESFGSGDCCTPHAGAGCEDASTESCVCGLDGFCCTQGWDDSCALTARGICNGCL